jgi:hypothetical protein
MVRFSMTGGPGTLPEPQNPSANLPSPLCLSRLAPAPAACRSTVMLHGVEKPSSRLDPLLKKKKRRPRVLEDGAGLTEMKT